MPTDTLPVRRDGRELGDAARRAFPEPPLTPLVGGLGREVVFEPRERIYRTGDPARCFYAFSRGEVEISKEGSPPCLVANESGLGLLDVLSDRPRTSTATAVTRVRAMKIVAEDYLDYLEDHFEVVMTAVVGIAARLHEINQALAPDGGFDAARTLIEPPPEAPRSMDLVKRLAAFRECTLFRHANVQALVALAGLAREVRVDAGGALFQRSEGANKLFLVAGGVIEARCESPSIVASFGPGELVGGHAALGPASALFGACARSKASVLAFSSDDFFDVMEEQFELTRSVLAGMAREYERLLLLRDRREGRAGRRTL